MGDLRFERTDELLQLHFLKLLAEVPFERISVSKLAKASKIDRTTFYAHYENTYQLAETLINNHISHIKAVFKNSARQHLNKADFDNYSYFSEELVGYLMAHRQEIQQLRRLNFGRNSFNDQLRNLFHQAYAQTLHLVDGDFSQYIMTTLAMSNFDFIMERQRVPSKSEIKAGLAKMLTYLA